MELKPGYKQTELGVIPENWRVLPLSACSEKITDGEHQTPKRLPSGYYLLSARNIHDGCIDLTDVDYVGEEEYQRIRKHCDPDPGDVLISCSGTVGRVATVPLGLECVLVRSAALVKPSKAALNGLFLQYFLQSWVGQKQIFASLNQGAQANLFQNHIQKLQITLPPTEEEQETIATALRDADALIESLEQLLAKKRQIKQGAMQELLTGKKRLPGFASKWETRLLGNIAHIKTGTRNNEDKIDNGDYPFFVRSDNVERISSYSHDCEAILVPGEGRIGEIFHYVTGRFDVHQRVYAITQFESGVSAKFVYLYMSMKFGTWALQNTVKATVDSLRLPTFQTFEMQLPATETEQTAIASVLSAIDAEIAALEIKLTKTRQIKQGMMQELLTGRIRLVRPSAQVLSFPVKERASASDVSHNTHFNEAVVIAVLSATFGSEKFPLGRFRRTKFSYLLHRHVEHEAAGFMKKAAGPYNPRTRYGGPEKIALQNRYVRIIHTQKGEGFVADEKIAQAEDYFNKWYGAGALTWLEQFRYQKNDALELLTTVDMACEDLSRVGKAATLSAVKQIIHDSPEWKAKLNRAVFSDDNIATTIQSCGQLFPIEKE